MMAAGSEFDDRSSGILSLLLDYSTFLLLAPSI